MARVFVYLPPFISQILDFIYWMVLIFILIYFEWRDTENQQYVLDDTEDGNHEIERYTNFLSSLLWGPRNMPTSFFSVPVKLLIETFRFEVLLLFEDGNDYEHEIWFFFFCVLSKIDTPELFIVLFFSPKKWEKLSLLEEVSHYSDR